MKNIFYLSLVIFLLSGCQEKDPGFTSLIGSWKYSTPDDKIAVTFDIVGGSTELLVIQNQSIAVDGVDGKAELESDGVQETTIKSLRINANDPGLTYPYNILFTNLKASEDFSTLEAEMAAYTFPWTTSNTLTNIQIVRK